mgnify:CR=1 FL=1
MTWLFSVPIACEDGGMERNGAEREKMDAIFRYTDLSFSIRILFN